MSNVELLGPEALGGPAPPVVPAAEGTTASGMAPGPALTLPAPALNAPVVEDTRPPRPPGVGPSVTPAPVVFAPVAGLPTLPAQPPLAGPVPPSQVSAVAALDPATCLTLGDVLGRIPQASNWTQFIRVSLAGGGSASGMAVGGGGQPLGTAVACHQLRSAAQPVGQS